jgi:hypothetical protein
MVYAALDVANKILAQASSSDSGELISTSNDKARIIS